MAFRKRNVAVGPPTQDNLPGSPRSSNKISGVRPSSLTSQPVTSTGAASLDSLLGGHGGLALGCSLLLEESGTTDFAGALLRYYAAEGVCHGHILHVVGVGEGWIRELPGVAHETRSERIESSSKEDEKMKIAWRYERLGQAVERGAWMPVVIPSYKCRFFLLCLPFVHILTVSIALPERSIPNATSNLKPEALYCHTFDMSKRLVIPQDAKVNHIQLSPGELPFDPILQRLEQSLKSSPPNSIHRLVMPTILSPALYPPHASTPGNLIRFLHSLRSLLRRYPSSLTAMMTLPLELHPRTSGLVRWAEILSDGVIEITPFPHLMDASNALVQSGGAQTSEEQPQGMVKVHKMPINSERGEGGAGVGNSMGEDLAFTVSRRKFVIKPFSLPPLEGDQEAQKEAGKLTGKEVEF